MHWKLKEKGLLKLGGVYGMVEGRVRALILSGTRRVGMLFQSEASLALFQKFEFANYLAASSGASRRRLEKILVSSCLILALSEVTLNAMATGQS